MSDSIKRTRRRDLIPMVCSVILIIFSCASAFAQQPQPTVAAPVSKEAVIYGQKINYVEAGSGPVVILLHGMLGASLISAVLANRLPGHGSVYLSQTLKFVAPVYPGDTVTARVRVTHIREDKPIVTLETTCSNQRDELLIKGEAVILVQAS